jgi:hypothetical protein
MGKPCLVLVFVNPKLVAVAIACITESPPHSRCGITFLCRQPFMPAAGVCVDCGAEIRSLTDPVASRVPRIAPMCLIPQLDIVTLCLGGGESMWLLTDSEITVWFPPSY